jgi:hypothetical protein
MVNASNPLRVENRKKIVPVVFDKRESDDSVCGEKESQSVNVYD